MRYVLEFGVRGGAYTENVIIPTRKLAEELAAKLVLTYTNDPRHPAASRAEWRMPRACPRQTWTSSTHFVAISRLDGVPRGPASSGLWRKPAGPEPMNEQVVPHNT